MLIIIRKESEFLIIDYKIKVTVQGQPVTSHLLVVLAVVLLTSPFSFAADNPCYVPPRIPIPGWSIREVFWGGSIRTDSYGKALDAIKAELSGPIRIAWAWDCQTNFLHPYCRVETWVDRSGTSSSLMEMHFKDANCPPGFYHGGGQFWCIRDYSVPVPTIYNVKLTADDEDDAGAGILVKIEPGEIQQLSVNVTGCGGGASSGAEVKLVIEPVNGTGGHAHHDEDRPKGLMSNGVTAESEITVYAGVGGSAVTFLAPKVSGDYKITASCLDRNCNQQGDDKIWVGIEDLIPLNPSPVYSLIGSKPEHPNGHYLTYSALLKITALSIAYNAKYPGKVLHLNDASLERGGIFDIYYDNRAIDGWWKPPHTEHRRGTVIDIRANGASGSILPDEETSFRRLAKRYDIDVRPHGSGSNRHFHVRIMGVRE